MKTIVKTVIGLGLCLFFAKSIIAQTDVMIAIDLSGSMQANDRAGNRFTGADQFLTMFSLYGNNRGGVISFGVDTTEVIKLEYLSFDQAGKFKPILDRLSSEQQGATELGRGLEHSRVALGLAGRKASIILISDGIIVGNQQSRGLSASGATEQAKTELWSKVIPSLQSGRISVYTIGLMGKTKAGEPTLQKIAQLTGGFYTPVEDPDEFPQIYKRMLDDIGQPSGVAELTNNQNSIVLTPFDQGVIIFGPTRFVVRAPNNLTYSTDKETISTPVRQRFFEYSNNTAILFLGRPDNIEQNSQFWNGKWLVEELNGKGEATFISNVRLTRDTSVPRRRQFFLNEYYPIQYRFDTQPGFDAESILSKCRAEFILVPQGSSTAKPLLKGVSRNGNVFSGDSLLENEGDYLFEIKIIYQDGNVERWTQRDRFHVNNIPLITFSGPTGTIDVGSKFRLEAKETDVKAAGYPEVQGLVDSAISFSLHYGSDDPISLPQTTAQSGIFRTEEIEFEKAGDLEIRGLLEGKLLMQLPGPNGEDALVPYKVRSLVAKKLKVENTGWALVWTLGSWAGVVLSVFASLLTVLAWAVQGRKFAYLDQAVLVGKQGSRTITLEPQNLSRTGRFFRWFRRRGTTRVGGPSSGADVTAEALKKGGDEPVLEIGVNRHKEYNITRTGTLPVWLNGRELEPDQPEPISERDTVDIPGVGKFSLVD